MKKLMAIILTVSMVLGGLTGCSNSKTSSNEDTSTEAKVTAAADSTTEDGYGDIDTGESKYPVAADLETHKIGVIWYGYTDLLGASVKKNMEYIGKQFNCEIVFSAAYLPEDIVSETENLIQNGVEGIMTLGINANMIEQCDKAGVYIAQFCNETTDEEILGMMKDSKFFVGMVNENDEACGEAMVDDLYERGCRNIVWLSLQAGASANHDNRVRGIEKAIAKYSDLNVLSNYRGDEMADALTNFAVTYPEMDGIITTGGASEEIYQVMSSEGLSGKVTFATIDIGEGTGDRLESGDLGWIGGGQFPTSSIAFSLLYNAITGNKILEDNTQVLLRQFMVLQNMDDYNNYVTYVEGDIPPYTGDEIKALIKEFNPDASIDLYNEYNTSYSIGDVVTRHSNLFQ
ncbi:MAG: sugar ABC transporter substrate-binding protein [Mobilitalea sp.]